MTAEGKPTYPFSWQLPGVHWLIQAPSEASQQSHLKQILQTHNTLHYIYSNFKDKPKCTHNTHFKCGRRSHKIPTWITVPDGEF